MGFFKNLFKKKPGGTFFGNLLRKGANVATGGILGNGAGLAAWEAKQAQQQEQADMIAWQNSQKIGSALGNMAKPFVEPVIDKGSEAGAKVWLMKNWWKVLIPVVVVITAIILIVKRKPRRGYA
ncbi:hypothetical protein N7U66_01990 [Lacinutrix neustonica]|uniref:Uncharacterized protein n=1 Tax=Lacinutrix neustonica TaxID=2980107 RepID=A0A9E8SE93_9FLAO|nr:hypothetical protein [Lacinutrix neustonica]WAC02507.1 hypothetical protein N7U66_01990 [Lacinutrix neustonica]